MSPGTVTAVVFAVVLTGILLPKLLLMTAWYPDVLRSMPVDVRLLVHPVFRVLLVWAAWVWWLRPRVDRSVTFGLRVGRRDGTIAFLLGLAATLPMLALGLWSGGADVDRDTLHGTIVPGFQEELIYRAFFFGVLVQAARWHPWRAAIVTGIVFGLAHIDITPAQGQTILGQLNMWNAIIALGGVMYAWIYWKAPWNLWVVIALHFAMNLWWGMFELDATPLGGGGATAARIMSVAIAVYLIVFKRALDPGASSRIDRGAPDRDD